MGKFLFICITVAVLSACSATGSCCKSSCQSNKSDGAHSCECSECKEGKACSCGEHDHSKNEAKEQDRSCH